MKTYKPVTPSLRNKTSLDYSELSKEKPIKQLTKGMVKSGGRNNKGRITVRHIGGGHKQKYRLIDWKRNNNSDATVVAIEYDPIRTSNIALIKYDDSTHAYILAANDLKPGDIIKTFPATENQVIDGSAMNHVSSYIPLSFLPVGKLIHNIESLPGKGGKYIRSAGSYGTVMDQNSRKEYTLIKFPSGELRYFLKTCRASIGVLSNIEHRLIYLGKAGSNRWRGIRPTVRGVAMNPIDHPHGGGEGKTTAKRPSVSPWGKLTKGKKTRNVNKKNKLIFKRRK